MKFLRGNIRSMKQQSTSRLLKHETGKYCNEKVFKVARPLKPTTPKRENLRVRTMQDLKLKLKETTQRQHS